MWEQIGRTSRYDLLIAVYIEETLDIKKKCECKLTLYNSNLPSVLVQPFTLEIQARGTRRIL